MKDFIKQFIVQVQGHHGTGSGVIIQSDKENFYIFTAKHNLAYKDEDKKNVQKIKLENINYDIKVNKIKVLYPYLTLKISDVIFLDNNFLDFVILKVDKKNNKELKDLEMKKLEIFNDDFKECVISGYPKIRGDNSIEHFDCRYETKVEDDENLDYKDTFEVYSYKPLYTNKKEEMETIVGISGGGIFVEGSDNNIYLAGIEIEYKGIRNLVCINLRDIVKDINDKLKNKFDDKINVGGFSLYEKFGIDIEKLELNSIKDEISEKNDYINNILKEKKGNGNEYNFFKNPKNEYFKQINQEYKSVENLAKAFLYNGIVFHENKDYNRATRHFKKAVKLDPSLEVYFAQSKFKREKGLSDKQKEEIEKNIANISSDNEEKIIDNLVESINNEQELELKILRLNQLLYRKITSLEYLGDYYIEGEYKGKEKFTNLQYSLELKERFDEIREEIIKYTKKLSDFYLKKRDFINAQIGLKGLQATFKKLLNDHEINKELLKIYEESQNDFFGNSCIDRTSLLDELFAFMDRFESNSDEYKKIKEMIKNISKVDNKYTEFTEKIKNFEKNYDEKIGSLSLGLKHISNNIVDKDVLMKIDFMLEHLSNSHGSLNIKLDKFEENRIESKKNYQNILKIFKMIMEKGNKELEGSIKEISNRNGIETRLMLNQVLRRVERGLDNIEIVQDRADFSKLDNKLKGIVADEIENFYTKTDNSKKIIDEKDKIIRLIQRRYGEHVLSLKQSLEDKNQRILDLKVQFKGLKQWLDGINENYESKKIQSKEVETRVNELTEINKRLEQNISIGNSSREDLKKYKLEIKNLEELVLKLEGKNEQINELKDSIKTSRTISDDLISLKSDCKKEIEKKDTLQLKIFSKVKNIETISNTVLFELRDKSKELNHRLREVTINIKKITSLFDGHLDKIEKELKAINQSISLNGTSNKNNFKIIKEKMGNLSTKIDEIERYALDETLQDTNKMLIKNEKRGDMDRQSNKLLFVWLFSSLAIILTISFFLMNPPKYFIENSWSKLIMDFIQLF